MSRLSENDYDLVYSAHGGAVAHIKVWTSAFGTVCGQDFVRSVMDGSLYGTGSQAEYDKARSLRKCKRCHDLYFGKETE